MCAGRPWNRTSPASNGKMPATHLISVDLPAPLSPTSAVTSPGSATRSTPRRACTAPKFLWPPRTSRVGGGDRSGSAGVSARTSVIVHLASSLGCGGRGGGAGRPAPRGAGRPGSGSGDARGGARVGERLGAHVLLGRVAVGDDVLDVVEVDRLGPAEARGDLLVRLGVRDRAGGQVRRVPAGRQGDGQGGGGVRLLLHGLVDRHALVAGQDVLQPLVGGGLPGDG